MATIFMTQNGSVEKNMFLSMIEIMVENIKLHVEDYAKQDIKIHPVFITDGASVHTFFHSITFRHSLF